MTRLQEEMEMNGVWSVPKGGERSSSWYKPFNKYKNQKQTYGGFSYDSKREAEVAWELDQRKKSKDIMDWDKQRKIEFYGPNGSKICNYYVDFVITHNDGHLEYLEVKGFKTAVWALKKKLMEDWVKGQENAVYTVRYV